MHSLLLAKHLRKIGGIMQHLTISGLQWGDEGKGKIVDILAENYDVIIRFQGGHNAGHTLVIGDKVFKLSLLPSGIVRADKLCVIGNGVVINPEALHKEIETLQAGGIDISGRLKIADNAALILPIHSHIETLRGQVQKIGTTARGIGPAYEDKIARRAIRICDLYDEKHLKQQITALTDYHNIWLKGMGEQPIIPQEIIDFTMQYRDLLLRHAVPIVPFLHNLAAQNKRFLFEGAQGALLDIDHGTYPFVTSSNTIAGAVAAGSGVGGNMNTHPFKLGIIKAYCTRVGNGIFPSEDDGEAGDILAERGAEFGTVTGRKRRCGWLDLPLLRHAINISGIDGLLLTKLDVLDTFETINICTHYHYQGEKIDYLPNFIPDNESLTPIYHQMQGWQTQLREAKSISDFPQQARDFIDFIEAQIQLKIMMVSTGPDRKHIIISDLPNFILGDYSNQT